MAVPKLYRVKMQVETLTRAKGNVNDILSFGQITDTISVTVYKPAYAGAEFTQHIADAISEAIDNFKIVTGKRFPVTIHV